MKKRRGEKWKEGNYFFFHFKNTSHMTNFLFSVSSTYSPLLRPYFYLSYFLHR
jgi:hypothetical protein